MVRSTFGTKRTAVFITPVLIPVPNIVKQPCNDCEPNKQRGQPFIYTNQASTEKLPMVQQIIQLGSLHENGSSTILANAGRKEKER